MTTNAVWKARRDRFEQTVLPHLNAAYNLARWLTGNEQDAEDVVQESYLRALRSFDTFQSGRDSRGWLLKVVRNTCYTWLRENRGKTVTQFQESGQEPQSTYADPETELIEKANSDLVRHAIEALNIEYREVLILRELEGLSYKEIAHILEVPLGTVMSRLSRGRKELQLRLFESTREAKT
ncbi:MAG: sigma-70 family RNA polymerase sigma factor [Acidobacteria bacterium]|nr:sigma-70 family RNA polymerase sigma factor [Acidobacteriota bacterium]